MLQSFSTRRRKARVVLLPTNTSGNLILFFTFLILLILCGSLPVVMVFVLSGALALARLREVVFPVGFSIVDGLRPLS